MSNKSQEIEREEIGLLHIQHGMDDKHSISEIIDNIRLHKGIKVQVPESTSWRIIKSWHIDANISWSIYKKIHQYF